MSLQNKSHNPDSFHVSFKLILKNQKGEILALKMPENSSMAGFYDIPGGRMNPDEFRESYEKIVKREVAEEIGKSVRYSFTTKPVSIARHYYLSPESNKEMHIFFIFFEALYLSGEIKISDEHAGYQWIKLNSKGTVSKYFTRGLKEGFENYLLWH